MNGQLFLILLIIYFICPIQIGDNSRIRGCFILFIYLLSAAAHSGAVFYDFVKFTATI